MDRHTELYRAEYIHVGTEEYRRIIEPSVQHRLYQRYFYVLIIDSLKKKKKRSRHLKKRRNRRNCEELAL